MNSPAQLPQGSDKTRRGRELKQDRHFLLSSVLIIFSLLFFLAPSPRTNFILYALIVPDF